MKNFDVSLIEYGLARGVFTPSAVLDLLYTPLQIVGLSHSEGNAYETISTLTWSVNEFPRIPTGARKKLIKACFATNAEETTLELNRRFACVIYALLREQNDVMRNADWCIAFFECTPPAEVMQEIYLWHQCGLVMNKAKHYLLERIFNNMLESKRVILPAEKLSVWVNEEKTSLKKMLAINKREVQRRLLKLTLAESFIQVQDENSPEDISEMEALKKEKQNLTNILNRLFADRFALEIQCSILEIYRILQADFPIKETTFRH